MKPCYINLEYCAIYFSDDHSHVKSVCEQIELALIKECQIRIMREGGFLHYDDYGVTDE